MASSAAPFSGDRGVCAAVTLGWQMAQLFHAPVHEGPVADPQRGDQLPGRSHFSAANQSKWLGEQIQTQLKPLLHTPARPVLDAMAEVLTALDDPSRSRGTTLDAIFTLHCRLLEALTVADYRLGKSYGLGRAMAETALLPAYAATDEDRKQKFQHMLALGPFARKGAVSHVVMEHSSVVKLLEWNFLGGATGQLSGRDGVVANMGSLLDPSATGAVVPEH